MYSGEFSLANSRSIWLSQVVSYNFYKWFDLERWKIHKMGNSCTTQLILSGLLEALM